jgi:hypothetical protein
MMTTPLETPVGPSFGSATSPGDAAYAELCRSLRRYRDFCIALVLVMFFGRSLWAWLAGRSWIVGPDLAGLYVIGFPVLFLVLGGRDLTAWFRMWRSRRAAQARARHVEVPRRPWQYVTAGAVLGAAGILVVAAIARML